MTKYNSFIFVSLLSVSMSCSVVFIVNPEVVSNASASYKRVGNDDGLNVGLFVVADIGMLEFDDTIFEGANVGIFVVMNVGLFVVGVMVDGIIDIDVGLKVEGAMVDGGNVTNVGLYVGATNGAGNE